MFRFFLPLVLFPAVTSGLTIELRYDLEDAGGFFNQAGAKEALRAAANFYERLINDELGAINPADFSNASWKPTYADPATGLTQDVPGQANLVVPANTLIIFVGAKVLPAGTAAQAGPGGVAGLSPEAPGIGFPWANQVYNRGEPGAIRLLNSGGFTTPTDFAPWGGAIFFNSSISEWNFSTTSASGTTEPDALSVALHELAHVLGLGSLVTQNSWTTLASTGVFQGPRANQSFGSKIATDGFHVYPFGTASKAFGVFGRTHGNSTTPLMVSSLPHSNNFYVPTDLELAMLQDIGWELEPPQSAVSIQMNPGPQLRIPSTTGFIYQVSRSTLLDEWIDQELVPLQGNGTRLTWNDPQSEISAYYKITRQKAAPIAISSTSSSPEVNAGIAGGGLTQPPDLAPGACSCGGH